MQAVLLLQPVFSSFLVFLYIWITCKNLTESAFEYHVNAWSLSILSFVIFIMHIWDFKERIKHIDLWIIQTLLKKVKLAIVLSSNACSCLCHLVKVLYATRFCEKVYNYFLWITIRKTPSKYPIFTFIHLAVNSMLRQSIYCCHSSTLSHRYIRIRLNLQIIEIKNLLLTSLNDPQDCMNVIIAYTYLFSWNYS